MSKHDEQEVDRRPLDLRLIRRLFSYTQPYAAKRNWLLLLVVIRSIQLPALTWVIAAIINGPIAAGDVRRRALGRGWLHGAGAHRRNGVMHFRQRFALELGEAVVHDLRTHIFSHLQRMPMSFFHRTKLGRIISRMTSDVEDVRMGVQEVLFVSLVQVGQMAVAAAFMLWYDPVLFLMVLGLVPVLWAINHHFSREAEQSLCASAGFVQPRDGHAGRKRQRHPRHAGLRAAGRQRATVPRPGQRPLRSTTSVVNRRRACFCRCWI